MVITSAQFVTSAVRPAQYPPAELPEVAFAGRSNVGKSSLINRLVNRKHLVKTSRTPGRTQLINFFTVNDALTLVDLPGYGYARVPAAVRKKWGPMIETYITGRPTLRAVVMILDIRRLPGREEHDLTGWLAACRIPLIRVVTKADKLSRSKQYRQQQVIARELGIAEQDLLLFSAKTGKGRDDLWRTITART